MSLTREQKIALLNKNAEPVKENSKWEQIAKWNKDHEDSLEDYMIIAMRISAALKSKGMKQKELAKMMEVQPQSLTRIMKGRQNLTINTIRKIEKILSISLLKVNKIEESTYSQRVTTSSEVYSYNTTNVLWEGDVNDIAKGKKKSMSKGFLKVA